MLRITTSNFARSARLPNAVSISRGTPQWFTGKCYPALAPTWAMIKMQSIDEYTVLYKQILSRLDPKKVVDDLTAMTQDPVLLCWEKPGDFCHRRLVAEWLESELGIEVPELGVGDVSRVTSAASAGDSF